ncbi:hypothetical protein GvMRE_IIg205 [endosymbiont GvMRE of Glomus versiforme]|nr:hypothetical protein GvMRE_IIg243 [endosymbiont GvMRE of Glomus versiforme]RHZ35543.1 hypothetical protein GvMRE_IIg205 [endosymbiont GvMRE of Glomus versiforme]
MSFFFAFFAKESEKKETVNLDDVIEEGCFNRQQKEELNKTKKVSYFIAEFLRIQFNHIPIL